MKNTPVRVLHVVGGMDRGGVETLLMNIYRRVDRSRLQFDFAVHTDRPCAYDAEILDLGGRIFHHPRPSEAGIWRFARRFWETLRRKGPFAVVHSHVHGFTGLVLLLARAAEVTTRIAHSHTTSDGHIATPLRVAYRWLMNKLILINATHLLANSRASARALFGESFVDDRRFSILRNALEMDSFRIQESDRDVLRMQYSLPLGRTIIGHVGRFVQVKNHSFLLDVFECLRDSLPSAYLVLAGDGLLRETIDFHVRSRGLARYVHFLGECDDVPRLLGTFDILLFPSHFEGLGNVVVEAQAAGVPCLVSTGIPSEANLNLGLFRRLSLEVGAESWAQEAARVITIQKPSWQRRTKAIQASGYDVLRSLALLQETYGLTVLHG